MKRNKRSTFQNHIAESYRFRDTVGWIWRTVWGVRKTNPFGIKPLPQQSSLNAIRPRIMVGFVGDIMDMHQKTLHISYEVQEFIRPCDFLFGNFEATITTTRKPGLLAQVHDPSILDSLALLFPPDRTFLSLANNHAGDFPSAIFQESLTTIRQSGFHVFGLSQKPFVDLTENIHVVAASMWSNQPCPDILPFASFCQYREPATFNIAFPHWGYELELFPRAIIVQTGEQLLQKYDALVGHHSHVPQPLTAFNYLDTVKLLAFSLGDFCTGLKIKKYQYGIVCKVEIGPGEDGLWRMGAVEWHYTKVSPDTPKTMKVGFVSGVLP